MGGHMTTPSWFKWFTNRNLMPSRKRAIGSTTPAPAERDLPIGDFWRMIAMARQKCEESAIIAGMIKRLADNIVGSGYDLQMTTPDTKWNQEVESLWHTERDKLDIRSIRSWGRLQRAWWMRSRVDGDVGILLADGGKAQDGRVLSRVQTIEADRIWKDRSGQHYGIDFNETTAQPETFWIAPSSYGTGDLSATKTSTAIGWRDFVWFPHMPDERMERKRGVSILLQNLALIEDVEEIIENMVQKVKNESFIGLKFKMDRAPDGSMFGASLEETKTSEDGVKRKHMKMVPGMNIHMDPGEDAEVLESKTPHQQFEPFLRMLLRLVGSPAGLPLEMLLLDFSETNFSGGRGLMELAKKGFKIEQDELARPSSRVFQWWLSREIKHNGLKPPASVGNYWVHRWGHPGWPYLDPVKEVDANERAIGLGIKSRQQALDEMGGGEIEDVIAQLAKENEMMKAVGLSTSIKPKSEPLPKKDEEEEEKEDKEKEDGDEK